MRFYIFLIVFCLVISSPSKSQIGISKDGSIPDNSAILDLKSTSGGLLFPRMTTDEQFSIWRPAAGLMVFNTDSSDFYGFDGQRWIALWDVNDTIYRWCEDSIFYSGQWYNTIQIGTQCWMAENLNAGTMIPGATGQSENGNLEKHCYNNIEDSCDVFGGLYQWREMMAYTTSPGGRGICPEEWHITTMAEWDSLIAFLGGNEVAGGKLKATGARYWDSPNTGATNSSWFSAYGGGTYRPAGYFYFYLIRLAGIYWTSTSNDSYYVWRKDLGNTSATITPYLCEWYHSFSVRCVKD